ncbi:ABC transporter ATP-binding protein/permease [Pararhodospirillum oryzae]|uniref:ATP-binding protein n=1 Tax=Pararhodospirillum oryzae TaxID=478448 RepID=A0A512HBP8_9PROT|nr:ABC transporter ATP-binding protein/permease [Pararhodospirillum oryzae]GEO82868.1 ATP-binding protein [Pararhodospirillum oryzae]
MRTARSAPAQRPSSFLRRFRRLAGGYWLKDSVDSTDFKHQPRRHWIARALTAVLVVLTIAQVFIPISINAWSADLFNALEQRAHDRLPSLIGSLALILLFTMTVNASHLWIKRRILLDWRQWLTKRVLRRWMADGRQYQINHLPGDSDNPDGRIAEDIRISTEAAVDLTHSLFYCLLLLISFTHILWSLSGPLEITVDGMNLSIPGHMVWIALAYAAAGTTAALLLGRPLVSAVNRRQTCEADFRFNLVQARENAETIALLKGEPDERGRLYRLFQDIAASWNRQTTALRNIILFTSGYSTLSTAFPVLVTAPRYIAGAISLGTLMQTAQAFQQMSAALSWPIDNLARVAEWRASVERVLALLDALDTADHATKAPNGQGITVRRGDESALSFHDLTVRRPDGALLLRDIEATIQQGERVLISGDSVAALRLFKVVAGLWPWGSGEVVLPRDSRPFFLPRRPYLLATVGQTLAYPHAPEHFGPIKMAEALTRANLDSLLPILDVPRALDRVLSASEQKRLGFARLFLHRLDWLFIHEATDALDRADEQHMLDQIKELLPHATLLTVGAHRILEQYHHRRFLLLPDSDGVFTVQEEPIRWPYPHDTLPAWTSEHAEEAPRPVPSPPGGVPATRDLARHGYGLGPNACSFEIQHQGLAPHGRIFNALGLGPEETTGDEISPPTPQPGPPVRPNRRPGRRPRRH